MAELLIGELARRTGTTAATIRYYESIGLLKPASRSRAGYRHYGEQAVDELQFIRKAQGLGFSLEEIAGILQLSRSGQGPCAHVLTLAHQHLAAVDERIRRLQAFRKTLAADLRKWETRRGTAPCDGLCQWIVEAEAELRAEDGHRSLPRQRKR